MTEREPINSPLLAGWTIATGMAVVAFGVSFVVIGLGANGSVAVAAVLWLVVGLILGLPRRDLPPPVSGASVAKRSPAQATPVTAPAPSATAPARASVADAPASSAMTGTRPAPLPGPRGDAADDLQKIKGIGPALETLLHEKGIYHFDQIAAWTEAEIAWVDESLEGFKGRATRDAWVAQARVLAAGGDPETVTG
ncbi:NADH:ubiquinone oxidoreductase [Pararhodobacter sp. SW119]|uniref:NADH:ubiquinone oxidoreductase n=1 Tax=Pararhodobacter sp. SW119 TaxID=2780075 RepID=UPI001ADF3F03|nr:NADH:ubiquinone oxidoreductase [Pararhodobacter sp. SW119]